MKYLKILLLLILSVALFLKVPNVLAESGKTVTIINPIRGDDFWSNKFSILEGPQKEYQIISQNNLPATWLVRFDALTNTSVDQFLKSLNSKQEVGLFMEITPSICQAAGVTYHTSANWHYPNSVFLSGYNQNERKKLIDTSFAKYKEIFGVYPKSVGAWWIDAYSLSYMKEKYGITANLDVSDQYSTDQYQVWGQYFSSPFYPSKLNALVPASSAENKIGVVTMQWATRDPYNSYGNGVHDSTFSVQANDYLLHNLDVNYLEKLIRIYPQTTIGLENDYDFNTFGNEYKNQINLVANLSKSEIATQTMSQFAQTFATQNPTISPNTVIQATDPLGGNGQVIWYQTPGYRAGLFLTPDYVAIRDLRIYNDSVKEPCFDSGCANLNLAKTFINAIDDVTYGTKDTIDQGFASNIMVQQKSDELDISYKNQAGVDRKIRFLSHDIQINDQVKTLAVTIADTMKSQPVQSSQNSAVNLSFNKSTIPNLLIGFIKFLIFSLLFIFLPGFLLIRRKLLAIPLGWAIFTVVSFIFGWLKLDILLWLIPILSVGGLVYFKLLPFGRVNLKSLDLGAILITIIGSITWVLTVVKSGLDYAYGLGFWGPNGHDAIWHLALISALQKSVPPQNPDFAGQLLTNYHYFFDLLLAKTGSLLNIDISDLLFRFFPLLLALLAGLLLAKLVQNVFNNKLTTYLALFFLYFGGSFGWIVTYFKNHTLGGESLFWAQSSLSTLLNPPFAISIVLLLAGLVIISEKRMGKKEIIATILLFGSLIEFKVYAGLLVITALVLLTTFQYILQRKTTYLITTIGSIILGLIVFLPNNSNSSSLVIFSPFWLVNSMIDFPDRLGWLRLSMARQAYSDTGNWAKFLAAEVVGLAIFLFGNLGSRFLFLGAFKNPKNIFKNEIIFILTILIVFGTIVPLIFIQKGTNWNIIQFFYYTLFAAGIFSAYSLSRLIKKFKIIGIILTVILILLTIPTTFDVLSQYLPNRPPAALPVKEIEALNFLKAQPDGIVVSELFDEHSNDGLVEPIPLYAYTSTSYVSAFSGHPSFLEDTINLDILGVDYNGRVNEINDLFKIPDNTKEILKRNDIKYMYVIKSANFQEDDGKMGIQKIFDNGDVRIFKVI